MRPKVKNLLLAKACLSNGKQYDHNLDFAKLFQNNALSPNRLRAA